MTPMTINFDDRQVYFLLMNKIQFLTKCIAQCQDYDIKDVPTLLAVLLKYHADLCDVHVILWLHGSKQGVCSGHRAIT
jgi:hypothetical protein